ncbi:MULTISPECIES: transketolase family protein [Thermodesulfovibrio]|jgi:transketolase|uniref:transketolase family protein n=1 Tax=Thermodesulfovibrio TaxID=28261 RepID=UPI00263509D7|nr:transketolase family protein [Thermodesulfovibrio sp.]
MAKTECSCQVLEISDLFGKDMATRDAYGATLVELGKQNPNIVVLDADLSCSTKTINFARNFPDRFFNMGVSEQDMMGTAAGLALAGKIPFASTFAIFATGRAWEQIRQSVCYSRANVKIVATHGGITVGEDGATHQSVEDVALMRVIPGMTVIVPADAYETAQALIASAEYNGPVYIRLGRAKVPSVMPKDYNFSIGKAYIFNIGSDVNIIANGIMVAEALKAAQILNAQGINTGVTNFSCVKPIDDEALYKIGKNSKLLITAEEHSIIGGLGSAVAEFICENCPVPIRRIGVNDTFGCSGDAKELLKYYGLTAENIVQLALEYFKK